MSTIIIGGTIYCPLCGKPFIQRTMLPVKGKDGAPDKPMQTFYVCLDCTVSINSLDSALGRWEEIDKPDCPMCDKPMPVFFRAIDGYTQYYCKKCNFVSAVGADEFLPAEDRSDKRLEEKPEVKD